MKQFAGLLRLLSSRCCQARNNWLRINWLVTSLPHLPTGGICAWRECPPLFCLTSEMPQIEQFCGHVVAFSAISRLSSRRASRFSGVTPLTYPANPVRKADVHPAAQADSIIKITRGQLIIVLLIPRMDANPRQPSANSGDISTQRCHKQWLCRSYACCSRSRPVNAGQPALFDTLQRRHFFQRIRETTNCGKASIAFATSSPRSAFGANWLAGKAVACADSPVRSGFCRQGGHAPVNQLPGGHQGVTSRP